jgi:hypothetical protein
VATQLCAACRKRPALFKYRGKVKADRDHTLCFRCFRDQQNRLRRHEMGLQSKLNG